MNLQAGIVPATWLKWACLGLALGTLAAAAWMLAHPGSKPHAGAKHVPQGLHMQHIELVQAAGGPWYRLGAERADQKDMRIGPFRTALGGYLSLRDIRLHCRLVELGDIRLQAASGRISPDMRLLHLVGAVQGTSDHGASMAFGAVRADLQTGAVTVERGSLRKGGRFRMIIRQNWQML